MNSIRQRLLCGVAHSMRPDGDHAPHHTPRNSHNGLPGNPRGHAITHIPRKLWDDDSTYASVERLKARLHSGPTRTNGAGYLGRRGD
jgi:hypothetical protein